MLKYRFWVNVGLSLQSWYTFFPRHSSVANHSTDSFSRSISRRSWCLRASWVSRWLWGRWGGRRLWGWSCLSSHCGSSAATWWCAGGGVSALWCWRTDHHPESTEGEGLKYLQWIAMWNYRTSEAGTVWYLSSALFVKCFMQLVKVEVDHLYLLHTRHCGALRMNDVLLIVCCWCGWLVTRIFLWGGFWLAS